MSEIIKGSNPQQGGNLQASAKTARWDFLDRLFFSVDTRAIMPPEVPRITNFFDTMLRMGIKVFYYEVNQDPTSLPAQHFLHDDIIFQPQVSRYNVDAYLVSDDDVFADATMVMSQGGIFLTSYTFVTNPQKERYSNPIIDRILHYPIMVRELAHAESRDFLLGLK